MDQGKIFNLFFSSMLLFLVLLSNMVYSQNEEWEHYTGSYLVNDIEFEGDTLWAGLGRGGLMLMSGSTKSFFNTGNSMIPSNNVNKICIDSEGNKWLGTANGLAKFDGLNWTIYNTDNSDLPDNNVTSMVIDNNGNLWFYFADVGLVKFDEETWTVNSDANSDIGANIFGETPLLVDSVNNIWVGGTNRLMKFDGSTWTGYDYWDTKPINELIREINLDAEGNVWVASSYIFSYNLSKFDGTTWTTFNSSADITSIDFDSNGNVWLASGNYGLLRFDGQNFEQFYPGNQTTQNYRSCYDVYVDDSDDIWVGTYGAGLQKFDGVEWTAYSTGNSGLPDRDVRAIAIDSQGNKWIGTGGGGVAKFDGTNWTVWDSQNGGIPYWNVVDVAVDVNDDIWIAPEQSGLGKYDGTGWTFYNTGNSPLPSDRVMKIIVDSDGNKWICTARGLVKYDNSNWVVYDLSNSGIPSNVVYDLAIDSNGTKWIGTDEGLAKFDNMNWEVFNTSNSGIPANTIREVTIDKNGAVWVATSFSGVAKFDGSDWTVYNNSNTGMPMDEISELTVDNANNIWIGNPSGVLKYDGNIWTLMDSVGVEKLDYVECIVFDNENGRWIGLDGQGGLYHFIQLYLSVDQTTFNIGPNSGEISISVSSNVDWYVDESEEWLSVSPASGSGDGIVTVSYDTNMTVMQRTGTIQISGQGIVQEITIQQAAGDSVLMVTPANHNVSYAPGQITFTITSNIDWNVVENEEWFSVDPVSGSGAGTVTVSYDTNATVVQRVGNLIITGGHLSDTVMVTQSGSDSLLTVTPANHDVPHTPGQVTFTITSNLDWNVTENEEWLSVEPVSGSGAGTVTVSYDTNATVAQRLGAITITSGTLSDTVTVTQSGSDSLLIVTPANHDVSQAPGQVTFTITSNLDWNVVENEEWLSVEPVSGTGAGTVTVSFDTNATVAPRVGAISITSGNLAKQVTITQAGSDSLLTVTLANQDVSFTSGQVTFQIISNIDWIIEENADWVSVEPENGSGNTVVTVSYDSNTTVEPRVAEIVIKGGHFNVQVTVNQEGNTITGLDDQDNIPDKFALHQNYPNPFNPTTQIQYDIPKTAHVEISVYSITGQKVMTLVNGQQKPGSYHIEFSGERLSSGIYVIMMKSEYFTKSIKAVLVK